MYTGYNVFPVPISGNWCLVTDLLCSHMLVSVYFVCAYVLVYVYEDGNLSLWLNLFCVLCCWHLLFAKPPCFCSTPAHLSHYISDVGLFEPVSKLLFILGLHWLALWALQLFFFFFFFFAIKSRYKRT